jgi:Fe-S protein assembly co-chaperone HscB
MKKAAVAVENRFMSRTNCPFKCFGLEPAVDIDQADLDQRYYLLQQAIHPDHFSNRSLAERTIAAEKSAEINAAYQQLHHPIERLWAFLAANGIQVDREANINNNPTLIAQVFELQEQSFEITSDEERANFIDHLQTLMTKAYQDFEVYVKERCITEAITTLHWLIYLDKLMKETVGK